MGVLWPMYWPNVVIAGPVLSGYALLIGLTEAQVGFVGAICGLIGLWQLVGTYLTRRVRDRRRFCFRVGLVEVTIGSAVILTGWAPPAARLPLLAGLLVTAFVLGQTVNPIFMNWMAAIIPGSIRASYIGRRMMYTSIASMIYLYLASEWLDMVPGKSGFVTVFIVGWICGILGYVMLRLTPYPKLEPEATGSFGGELGKPLRDPTFRALALFMCTWMAAGMMSGTFYSAYMINTLKLPYRDLAIYTNVTWFFLMIGYRVWGMLVQRYGSKPVIQLLIGPYVGALAVWTFISPANYLWLVPIQRMLAGIIWSGMDIANSSLLYKLIPAGKENTAYFANWTTFMAIGAAGGPFIGGLIRNAVPEAGMTVAGLQLVPLQVVFAVSSALCVLPLILSLFLRETEASSPRHLLGQLRGNVLSFAYNYGLFRAALSESKRAQAARALGRSRTPLAVDQLVGALEDVSPQVRSEAARGLGEMRSADAVEPLTDELHDDESDIRPEAAQALGKIGSPVSVTPLVEALADEDPRVRMSAALALGDIGGEQAREALAAALADDPGKHTFAALIEGASRLGDLRIIEPALQRLPAFRSPVLRMQVINSICRVLGEPRHFYRLLMADPVSRAGMRERMTRRIVRLIRRGRLLDVEAHHKLMTVAQDFRRAMDDDDFAAAAAHARAAAQTVIAAPGAPELPRMAALAITGYLDGLGEGGVNDEGVIFLLVCLTSIARFLQGGRGG